MEPPRTATEQYLHDAWQDFCNRLTEAGDLVFRATAPTSALDRATGYQYLARYITKALHEKLEFNDADFPTFWHLQTPTHKSFGDNPDCTYLVARINGTNTYRVSGTRGTVKWVSFVAGGKSLNNADLDVDADGGLEIWLSPSEHPGNWIPTAPGCDQLFVRQFFGHWDTEDPMRITIERVGADGPPPPITVAQVAEGLRDAGEWLVEDSRRWADWIDFYRDRPNEFVTGMPGWTGDGAQAALGRLLHFCYWRVESDEALVIRTRPPECIYWNFELGNYWMNSSDYRYRLSSLNSEQAARDADGSITIVVSHRDPGVANWLDTAGHTTGLMPQRWVEADTAPSPNAELVRFDDLVRVLGDGVTRVSPGERAEQLRRRRLGVERRFSV